MKAQTGDWLIVHPRTEGGHLRKAEIIATHAEGAPPYTVHWLDDGKQSVVFPGPDSQIVTAADQAALGHAQSEVVHRVQTVIGYRVPD
jgi:hypothetical protein